MVIYERGQWFNFKAPQQREGFTDLYETLILLCALSAFCHEYRGSVLERLHKIAPDLLKRYKIGGLPYFNCNNFEC